MLSNFPLPFWKYSVISYIPFLPIFLMHGFTRRKHILTVGIREWHCLVNETHREKEMWSIATSGQLHKE